MIDAGGGGAKADSRARTWQLRWAVLREAALLLYEDTQEASEPTAVYYLAEFNHVAPLPQVPSPRRPAAAGAQPARGARVSARPPLRCERAV